MLQGHEWIEVEGVVIDVTLDQFGEEYPKAYAGKRLPFHSALSVTARRSPITVEAIEANGIAIGAYYGQIDSLVESDMTEPG